MPRGTIRTDLGGGQHQYSYIDLPDSPSGEGGGGCLLLLILIGIVVVGIAQLIWVKTGVNVFDSFEGITGPCGTCTPTP